MEDLVLTIFKCELWQLRGPHHGVSNCHRDQDGGSIILFILIRVLDLQLFPVRL
jgi:hypothetical protein